MNLYEINFSKRRLIKSLSVLCVVLSMSKDAMLILFFFSFVLSFRGREAVTSTKWDTSKHQLQRGRCCSCL